jgi:hypothetical protein
LPGLVGAQLAEVSRARTGPMTRKAVITDPELPERLAWFCLGASRRWMVMALIGCRGAKLFENSREQRRLCSPNVSRAMSAG